MTRPVVFLDRDGVINIDSADYIKIPSEFHFIPNSPEAIALLCRNGFDIIVITNQSVIDRKMADRKTLEAIFQKMKDGVAGAGGQIKDVFYCPHLPTAGCKCRKPEPGLIHSAQKAYGLDLSKTIMVGDSAKDIETAVAAGCRTSVLVRTGNGKKAMGQLEKKNILPDHVAADLYEAACWIITHCI